MGVKACTCAGVGLCQLASARKMDNTTSERKTAAGGGRIASESFEECSPKRRKRLHG